MNTEAIFTVLITIAILIALGFVVNVGSPIGATNITTDINGNQKYCNLKCTLTTSYQGCNISDCYYCRVWWYSWCVVK